MHAHRHLHHLVGMRVVHERAAVLDHEFVGKGFAWLDVARTVSDDKCGRKLLKEDQ